MRYPYGMLALLRKTGVVDDPSFHGPMLLHGRENRTAYLCQQGFVLPGASATKWCKDWCIRCTLLGANLAAIGSTLLRSPGSKRPLQYDFNGSIRSACPAACARPWK